MSAAATAAGYLYASGRLRGRAAREQEEEQSKPERRERPAQSAPHSREKVRVAVLPAREDKPRRTPKIEYRTRKRWTPE
jgi:hypothetical protein